MSAFQLLPQWFQLSRMIRPPSSVICHLISDLCPPLSAFQHVSISAFARDSLSALVE
jgi:hypothetical protein